MVRLTALKYVQILAVVYVQATNPSLASDSLINDDCC